MRTIIDDKCLASWAVLSDLARMVKNRCEVLKEFIKASIYKNGLREFTVAVLTAIVNRDYTFKLHYIAGLLRSTNGNSSQCGYRQLQFTLFQMLLIIRASVVKIGFWRSFAIAFGGIKKRLSKDFEDSLKN